MALGLDDLKKRSSVRKTITKEEPNKVREDNRNIIRPWSNRGLAKAGVSRKQAIGLDFYINVDWIEVQALSFSWLNFEFDHSHEGNKPRLQSRLSSFENRLLSSVDKVKNFGRFFGFIAA